VNQLRQEKCELEETLEKEQECQVNKLMRRIEKLQAEVVSKQATLEQVLFNGPTLLLSDFYPNVTALRLSLCYRIMFVLCLSVVCKIGASYSGG